MPLLGRGTPLHRHLGGMRQLLVDPSVLPPVAEEGFEHAPVPLPLARRHAGDAGERLVIVGQPARLPVMHDEVQVRPALRRVEMRRLGEIVRDVERHPRFAHAATLRSPRMMKGFASRAAGR